MAPRTPLVAGCLGHSPVGLGFSKQLKGVLLVFDGYRRGLIAQGLVNLGHSVAWLKEVLHLIYIDFLKGCPNAVFLGSKRANDAV